MTHTNSFSLRRVSERVTSAAAAIAMTALLAIASDARAESIQIAPSVAVAYSAVDLASDKGAADLYRKLKRAAREVCNAYSGKTLDRQVVAQECFDKSLENAVYEVNAQRLTALHEAAMRNVG
jgi:UrcA family protein